MPNRKILVVEDEENVVELLKINMVRRGYDVVVATDGEEGMRLAAREHPDVLLLDIRLPGMDGWEVCRRLRSDPETSETRIVVLSAAAQKEDLEKSEACGASAFVAKPFEIAKLLEMISEL